MVVAVASSHPPRTPVSATGTGAACLPMERRIAAASASDPPDPPALSGTETQGKPTSARSEVLVVPVVLGLAERFGYKLVGHLV